jgi:serine/threonine-protein kinase
MPGSPQTGRNSYAGMVDGPPVTQPSSISVATGTHGRQLEAERPAGRRTAVAALIGVMLGASVLASALVYRHQQQTRALASEGAIDAGEPRLVGLTSGATTTPTMAMATAPTATATVIAEVADAGVVAADPSTTGTTAAGSGTAIGAAATTGANGGKAPGGKAPRPPSGAVTTKVTPPAPPTPPASPPPDCSTPTWFDAQGVKHYKPQCL